VDCPTCGHDNRSQARFCEDCGGRLAAPTCTGCGTELRLGAKFCDECGAAIASAASGPPERTPREYTPPHLASRILKTKSAIEGERKQVTVLFADVRSSVQLSGELDPEEWHNILDRFFEVLTEGVHRFEGSVNQYTGDGIMALFGAPIAHEDHAQRACYAALYLQKALEAHTDALRVDHGLNFSVRMGLNSGEVVVGRIGDDLRMDYTAQGQTVGLAQRMESLAEGGKALLAGDTIDLVEGYFELRDLGETKVKGVEQPVRVAELQGVGHMRTRLDRSRTRGLSKFVGRSDEMERLEAALERSLTGDGQVVGLVAEAGAGKSRLCYEFAEHCRSRGLIVRAGTGVAHGRATPLEPILQFYREIFGVDPGDGDVAARQKIAGLIAQTTPAELDSLPLLFDFMRVPDPANPAPDLSPDERMQAIIDLLRRLTAARSRREPAVLVFEDLHWLDPQTDAAIAGIADTTAGTRTLFVVNFRPEYRADWMARSHYQQIPLRPLDPEAAGELLQEWLGPDPSLAGFAEMVRDQTGGNPFFMEEVVRAQIEAGVLEGARGAFRLEQPVASLAVPASVESLLAARIDRLGETTKRLLQTVAVVGDECDEALLARVAGLTSDALRGRLRELVQAEFLYEASLYPELEYAFRHPLTRQVAYGSLLRDRKGELHARVAEAIEARAGDAADAQAPLIAHHWEEAGRPLEAARWQTRAGQGLGGAHVGEALYHWRKVIELLEGSGGGDADDAERETLLGQARAQVVYAASRSDTPEAEVDALVDQALQSLGDADTPARVNMLGTCALVRAGAGFTDQALAYANEALATARRLDDPSLIASTIGVAISACNSWERPTEVVTLYEELEEVCRGNASDLRGFLGARALIIGGGMSAMALNNLGRGDEATALVRRLVEETAGTEDAMEQLMSAFLQTGEQSRRGDIAGGLDSASRALELAEGTTNAMLRAITYFTRAQLLWRADQIEAGIEALGRAIDLAYNGRVNRPSAASWLGYRGRMRLEAGDPQGALADVERGRELARTTQSRSAEAMNDLWRGCALQSLAADGADAELRAAIDRAETTAGEIGSVFLAAHASEAAGDWAEAARRHRLCGDDWAAQRAEAKLASSV
jgi:class 3 adenylate cyclase